MDRIILAFASEKAHAQITRILGSGGLAPSISCFSGAETIRAARKLGGAVVICGFRLRDMTAETEAPKSSGLPYKPSLQKKKAYRHLHRYALFLVRIFILYDFRISYNTKLSKDKK